MLTHLNSVTGVPVCHYFVFSWQPLNGEFNKTLPMPRTQRQFSESEDFCILFRIIAFMIENYIIRFCFCQEFSAKKICDDDYNFYIYLDEATGTVTFEDISVLKSTWYSNPKPEGNKSTADAVDPISLQNLPMVVTNHSLAPLAADDREQFILDNQWAFKYGAMMEFGERDDPDEMFRFIKVMRL